MCDLICDIISCCVWSRDRHGLINIYMTKSWWKKGKKYGNKRKFYIDLPPVEGLAMEFTVELMPEGSLTSFTVCDACRYFNRSGSI